MITKIIDQLADLKAYLGVAATAAGHTEACTDEDMQCLLCHIYDGLEECITGLEQVLQTS